MRRRRDPDLRRRGARAGITRAPGLPAGTFHAAALPDRAGIPARARRARRYRLRRSPRRAHRSEEHTSELQLPDHLVCRLLLEKKKKIDHNAHTSTYTIPYAPTYRLTRHH